jgi:hypothetical protein
MPIKFTKVKESSKYIINYAVLEVEGSDLHWNPTNAFTTSTGVEVPASAEGIVKVDGTTYVASPLYKTYEGARDRIEADRRTDVVLITDFVLKEQKE